LIQITKEEAMLVRQCFPNVHVGRTGKGKPSRHHHYFMEANIEAMRLLPGNYEAVALVKEYDERRARWERAKEARKRRNANRG